MDPSLPIILTVTPELVDPGLWWVRGWGGGGGPVLTYHSDCDT